MKRVTELDPHRSPDLPAQLVELFEEYRGTYGQEPDLPGSEAFLREQLLGSRLLTAFVAAPPAAPSELIGFALVQRGVSSLSRQQITLLKDIFVRPECRQTGVATEMLEFILERSRAAGEKGVTLEVFSGNEPARRLYTKLGFTLNQHFQAYQHLFGEPMGL